MNWLRHRIFELLGRPNGSNVGLSAAEFDRRATHLAHWGGLPSAAEAWNQLDAGQLDGTQLEMELKLLRFQQRGRTKAHA